MVWRKKQKTYIVNGLFLVFLGILIWLIFLLWDIVLPFFLGILLSYLFLPLVRLLINKKIPLLISVIIIYGALAGFFYLLLFFALPELLKDAQELFLSLPDLSRKIGDWWLTFNQNMEKFHLPENIIKAISSALAQGEAQIASRIGDMVFSVFTFLKLLLSFLLAPMLSYYMLRDAGSIKKTLTAWLPPKHRPEILRIAGDINYLIRQFLYGYFLVSLIVGFLTFIALKIIGVRYALFLGLIMALADLIPYFGPFIGALPAIILAYLDSFRLAVLTIIVLVIIQQLESAVISPKIIGNRIGLHPLSIIFIVLAGGYWFGIWGMVLAVPFGAAFKLILAFIYSCAVSWKEIS